MSAYNVHPALTREVVDELFLYVSNLRAPLETWSTQSTRAPIATPSFDFASCLALALVSRHFAQCWRRFQAHYLLLTLEAIHRGRHLLQALQAFNLSLVWRTAPEVPSGSAWPHLFDALCSLLDKRQEFPQLGTLCSAERAFYNNRRCVAEVLRCERAMHMNGHDIHVVWHIRAFDPACASGAPGQPPAECDSFWPTAADARSASHSARESLASRTGDVLPQQLMELLAERLDYDRPWWFGENFGMSNALTALRAALWHCPRLFDGRKRTLSLPRQLFAKSATDAGVVSPCNVPLETFTRAPLVDATIAILVDAEGRARTMTFLLFRCAIAKALSHLPFFVGGCNYTGAARRDAHSHNVLDRLNQTARDFYVQFGMRMSSTHIVSVADFLLYRSRIVDFPAFECSKPWYAKLPGMFVDSSIALQTLLDLRARQLAPHTSRQFSAWHPGAVALTVHLRQVLGLLSRAERRLSSATLTLPLKLGRIPTLYITQGRRLHTACLSIADSNHTELELQHCSHRFSSAPITYLPFINTARGAARTGAQNIIGHWYPSDMGPTGSPHMIDWETVATAAFDVRLDDTDSLLFCDNERYREAVLADLAAPTLPDRPRFTLEPLSERISYIIEHLPQLQGPPDAAAQFLASCTTIFAYCRRCTITQLAADEYATAICQACAGSLKRKLLED
jgi:hypothetical protein